MKKIISTQNAPLAIGPYSQGVEVGGFYYFSGQIPLCPKTKTIVGEGDISLQTKQVIKNIDALLKSVNLSAESVVKSTVFITDMKNFAAVNKIYAEYFVAAPPARSCVEVSGLPMGVLVEIEVIAAG